MTPRRGRCVAALPAIFYTDTAPETYVGVIQLKIRLKIGAYGNWGALEFVFETYDSIHADGDLAAFVIVTMKIGPIISADVRAGTDIPAETGGVAGYIAMELIQARDAEAVIPEAGDAFECGVVGDKMFECDGTWPEFDARGIGVRLAFGLGKGTDSKEADQNGY